MWDVSFSDADDMEKAFWWRIIWNWLRKSLANECLRAQIWSSLSSAKTNLRGSRKIKAIVKENMIEYTVCLGTCHRPRLEWEVRLERWSWTRNICGYLSKPKYVKVIGEQVEKRKEIHVSGKGIKKGYALCICVKLSKMKQNAEKGVKRLLRKGREQGRLVWVLMLKEYRVELISKDKNNTGLKRWCIQFRSELKVSALNEHAMISI